MIRNILTLVRHDLAVAFKNKTVYLMVFIPLFVFFSLNVVDHADGPRKAVTLGLVAGQPYPTVVVSSLEAAPQVFALSRVTDEAEGERQVRDKTLGGLLLPDPANRETTRLVVGRKDSVQTLAIIESLTHLQEAAEKRTSVSWLAEVKPLQESPGLQRQTLPTWILMMILLVGLLVVPPQVAEEKEKKLLLGLLQTPMREIEWLVAKVLMGMMLASGAVVFLHAVGSFGPGDVGSYATFVLAGSFCFTSIGVLLGFLCRTQATARALGIFAYLPELLPSALADFSEKMRVVSAFVPSSKVFFPVRAILLDGATVGQFPFDLLCLVVLGGAAFAAAFVLVRRRWLM